MARRNSRSASIGHLRPGGGARDCCGLRRSHRSARAESCTARGRCRSRPRAGSRARAQSDSMPAPDPRLAPDSIASGPAESPRLLATVAPTGLDGADRRALGANASRAVEAVEGVAATGAPGGAPGAAGATTTKVSSNGGASTSGAGLGVTGRRTAACRGVACLAAQVHRQRDGEKPERDSAGGNADDPLRRQSAARWRPRIA